MRLSYWILAGLAVLALAACSSSSNDDNNQPAQDVADVSHGEQVDEPDTAGTEDTTVPEDDVAADIPCQPQCEGKECGPNGCGDECGTCNEGVLCSFEGKCLEPVGDCTDKECGSDGYGGSCGDCPEGEYCSNGQCTEDSPLMTCADLFDCLGECDVNDEICQQNCINSAPLSAAELFNALNNCLMNADYFKCWDICPNGREDPDCDKGALNDCFEDKSAQCEEELAECFPPGVWTCKEGWICIQTCPDSDSDCVQDCMGEMSPEAQDQWNAFIDCLDENGYFECFDLPEEDQAACLQPPWEICQPFLSECASGEATCKDIWDCMDTCSPIDEMCPYECLYDGTPEAQNAYYSVLDCVVEQCGDQPTQECFNNALEGACGSLYNDCIAL